MRACQAASIDRQSFAQCSSAYRQALLGYLAPERTICIHLRVLGMRGSEHSGLPSFNKEFAKSPAMTAMLAVLQHCLVVTDRRSPELINHPKSRLGIAGCSSHLATYGALANSGDEKIRARGIVACKATSIEANSFPTCRVLTHFGEGLGVVGTGAEPGFSAPACASNTRPQEMQRNVRYATPGRSSTVL
jgi:hypothetical protein